MKRVILLTLAMLICAGLFAQATITPYGSARLWYGFDMLDSDKQAPDGRTMNKYFIQNNSRFGVNFRNADLTARAEFGYNNRDLAVRYLWGRQGFDALGGFNLSVGWMDDGFDKRANQVYDSDRALEGYGAVYSNRNAQVKFEMKNGFYASLLIPNTANDPVSAANSSIDTFIPRINLGYNVDLDNIKIYPTASFQMYNYNKDFNDLELDETVMSYLVGATVDFKQDALSVRGQFHYGSNAGNLYTDGSMGPRAVWNAGDKKMIDRDTFGGFLMFGYDISDLINANAGFGYVSSFYAEDFDRDNKMAFYLQATLKARALQIIPEFGMMMDGDVPKHKDDTSAAVSRGNTTYFGTQLRLNF